MHKEQEINELIKSDGIDTNLISDGYHTFGELYDHRIALFIAVAKHSKCAWRSTSHSDGSSWLGWFVLGIFKEQGNQITYHLPMTEWDNCEFAETLDKAPEFDGHTSADVLNRIKSLANA